MDASRFDAATRLVGRRGALRALAGLLFAPLALRPRGTNAQVAGFCVGAGAICTAGLRCCDGAPCPLNINPWIGVCGGTALPQPVGNGSGGTREPNDGEALPRRAKHNKRREKRRAYRQRRKRGRLRSSARR